MKVFKLEESARENTKNELEQDKQINLEIIKKLENSAQLAISSLEGFDFHNLEHTKDVVRRFKTITHFLKENNIKIGTEREIQLGELSCYFHDTVQGYDNINNIRKRHIEENEKQSAEFLISEMDKINKTNLGTFSREDKDFVYNLIRITIPDFKNMNTEGGFEFTAVSKILDSKSSILQRSLTLSDLAGAGMDGPVQYKKEGDALFREENFDVKEIMEKINKGDKVKKSTKDEIKKRMLKWSEIQVGFVKGRKKAFKIEIDIEDIPKDIQEKLKQEIFNKFDESINSAQDILEKRKLMSFEELARDMGYNIKF